MSGTSWIWWLSPPVGSVDLEPIRFANVADALSRTLLTMQKFGNELDADMCAREPIHIIGHTQSHGYLIAVSEPDLIIRHISANVAGLVALELHEIVEHSLESILGAQQFVTIAARIRAPNLAAVNPIDVRLGHPALDLECVVHRHDGMLLLELEPLTGARSLRPVNIASDLDGPIARMEGAENLAQLAPVAAAEFARMSGFDRVMIYAFDADWNGNVIAEVGAAGPLYLGHHFPASDIPAQARRLFLINTLRSIVDIDSLAVPIVPEIETRRGRPLDLSLALLRSSSPTHIQYLRNMGVRASMTISIIIRGELWGMVAAHHRAPHRLDFSGRALCGLLGRVLAAQILARSDQAGLHERLKSRELIEAYMISLERAALPWHGGALETIPLLALLHADGIVSQIGGVPFRHGTTMDEAGLAPVVTALRDRAYRGIASSHSLKSLDPGSERFAKEASGALYIELSDSGEDFILLLREELVQTITWAGDPRKSITRDEFGGTVNPRVSFASWQQTVRYCSRAWTQFELDNAAFVRERFINAHLERDLRDRELRYEHERSRSTLFQRAVLPPRLPSVAGLAFDAVYEPGLSDANVGGDWYDAVRLLDGRVLVTIGDVSGSGINAAVIMGVVRQIMRGIAQLDAEPALMLDAADRALRLEYPEAIVTAWVGVFDLVERTLAYASAGHPPPLLIEADGGVRELAQGALPLGLREGHEGETAIVEIGHGSALWLYTDGLIEATHNIVAGYRLLRDPALLAGSAATPASTIRRLVIPDGSPDDVAIFVVQADFNDSERHMTRSHFDSADAFAARAARNAFVAALPPKKFSRVQIGAAEVVFGELCGNVARYAAGRVDTVLDLSGVQAVLHVLDRGRGFRHLSRLPADVFSEDGRGLFIIGAMTTEFTVGPRLGGGSHARVVLQGRYPISLLRQASREVLPGSPALRRHHGRPR